MFSGQWYVSCHRWYLCPGRRIKARCGAAGTCHEFSVIIPPEYTATICHSDQGPITSLRSLPSYCSDAGTSPADVAFTHHQITHHHITSHHTPRDRTVTRPDDVAPHTSPDHTSHHTPRDRTLTQPADVAPHTSLKPHTATHHTLRDQTVTRPRLPARPLPVTDCRSTTTAAGS